MSSLEELRKKLYGREEPKEKKTERGFFRRRPESEPKTFWGGESLEVVRRSRRPEKASRWFINVLIFSFVLLFGIAAYVGYEIFFVREEVAVSIAGPEGVEAGDKAQFAVFVRNTGQIGLSDVELNITYPEHSIALAPTGEPTGALREKKIFDRVAPGEEIKYDIAARFL